MIRYTNKEYNDLNEIINLIKENKIEGENNALIKFENHLQNIQNIGSFNPQTWNNKWREKVYEFGKLIEENRQQIFIDKLRNKVENENQKEVLYFVLYVILSNSLSSEKFEKELVKLCDQYPYNLEFKAILGNYYHTKKEYLKAIEQYKILIENEHDDALANKFALLQLEYLSELTEKGKYKEGKDYAASINIEKLSSNPTAHVMWLIQISMFTARFNDLLKFENRLKIIEKDFEKKVDKKLELERKQMIPILGFFSAIVAFILGVVSESQNSGSVFKERIYFIVGFGIILILFCITISLLFSTSKKSLFKDVRFLILITALIAGIFYITLI